MRQLPKRKGARQLSGRTKREFATNDARWLALRREVIAAQPVCPCGELVTDVDHRDNNPANNPLGNLQGLCKPCHSRKTRAEM